MGTNNSWEEMCNHYATISPESLSNTELAYAVIYSLTSMDYYDLSDDDEYDDPTEDDDEYGNEQDDLENEQSDVNEALYEASYLFWKQRCKVFQFELWQRGFEAIRLRLYDGIYIPVLQQRGYNIPISRLIEDFCSQCSTQDLEDLINLLLSQNSQEATDAATPFFTERQKRLN